MLVEYFLSFLLQGKRRFITRSQVKQAYAPHIEGLTLQEIIVFIKQFPEILEYLPEEEEMPRAGRDFICNVAYTLKPDEFTSFVRSKEQSRRAKLDSQQRNTVSLASADYAIDSNSPNVCPEASDNLASEL